MAESRESLVVQKRPITKRRITNLITKIDPGFAGQYINEIRELNNIFQSQHIEASASLEPAHED